MPAEPTMLLVHSPLLTPAMWDALRPHLEAAGWRVAVPDLRPLLEAPSFHTAACAAAAASVAPGTPTVVVGHNLQLSAAYQATADQAGHLGYRVRRRDADHLAMVTRPAMVADLLLSASRQ